MPPSPKTKRTCKNGHHYFKSSDCPTCPICKQERKPADGFLSLISAPARRALESRGITSLQILSTYSETEILDFHGIGPTAIPKLQAALSEEKLSFKK